MRKLLVVVAMGAGCSAASSEPKSNTVPRDPTLPIVNGRRDSFSQADYATHIRQLKAKLHKAGLDSLNVRIEDPFVVIGDGSAGSLARSSGTVRWAADKLEQDFFEHRPTKILDIFLFRTASSYEDGVRALTGDSPTTPYG